MNIEKNEVYTTKEVAALLKISLPTVKRMLKDGRLASTRVGKQHRFLGRDLLAMLESKEDLRRPQAAPAEARIPPPAEAVSIPPPVPAAPAAIRSAPRPAAEPEYVKSFTAVEKRQRMYVLGRTVSKDIYAEDGALIIAAGTVVNDDVVILARSNRRMMDLFMSLEKEEE